MNNLESLYRAVLASPDEDTPRLMYADEVEERGDPARAEMIRLQCELARVSENADWRGRRTPSKIIKCADRISYLLTANRERWEVGCAGCGWDRGFAVVQVPDMRQVWHEIAPKAEWEPTPWLLDLLGKSHVVGVLPLNAWPVPLGTTHLLRWSTVPPPVAKFIDDWAGTTERLVKRLSCAVVRAARAFADLAAQAAALQEVQT